LERIEAFPPRTLREDLRPDFLDFLAAALRDETCLRALCLVPLLKLVTVLTVTCSARLASADELAARPSGRQKAADSAIALQKFLKDMKSSLH
jgi:hypothetical protein